MEKKKVTIVTHSSKFHPDDIFGVATLVLVLENSWDVEIIRSRDPEVISKADYAVDVGFVYDPDMNRFDHHQIGGAGDHPPIAPGEMSVPYASFGLVWKKYGPILCGGQSISDKIELVLVQPIDIYDNGIELIEKTKIPGLYPADIRSLFYIFRPTWKENESLDVIFNRLVSYAKVIIQRQIICMRDEAEAANLVVKAYEDAPDKRIIVIDERYPWEEILERYPEPLFVVYPKRVDNNWSIKTIRSDVRSYKNRKDLPESWSGLNGAEFEAVTGVPGSLFCHTRLFLAVTKTKEAALKLAELALNA